jgi:[ribosomal protein S5]-alanine N-acetyltransferase
MIKKPSFRRDFKHAISTAGTERTHLACQSSNETMARIAEDGGSVSPKSGAPSSPLITPELTTQRLLLQPLELADAEQVQILSPHGEIVRYLANRVPWPYAPDGALRYYRDEALPAVERGEEWHWSLRLKSSPTQVIGSIALLRKENNNRGFWLGLPWQRQGLMSEACEVVTDYWFDVVKSPLLRVPKAAVNTASRRISEKSGMRIVATDERDYVSGRLLTEIWEITAEEWRTRARRRRTDSLP